MIPTGVRQLTEKKSRPELERISYWSLCSNKYMLADHEFKYHATNRTHTPPPPKKKIMARHTTFVVFYNCTHARFMCIMQKKNYILNATSTCLKTQVYMAELDPWSHCHRRMLHEWVEKDGQFLNIIIMTTTTTWDKAPLSMGAMCD